MLSMRKPTLKVGALQKAHSGGRISTSRRLSIAASFSAGLSTTHASKYLFVYADFRSRVYWFAPAIFVKEILCAATVWFFPSSGTMQSLYMSLVLFMYLILSLYKKPFPTMLQNHLDCICHVCLLLQINCSLGLANVSEAYFALASHALLVIQVLSLLIPAAVAGVIMTKAHSKRFAASLPDQRKQALEQLGFLERSSSDPMWGGLKRVLERYKVDEMELKEIVESIEVLVARCTDEDLCDELGLHRRRGSLTTLRESAAARDAAKMLAEAAAAEREEDCGDGELPGLLGVSKAGREDAKVQFADPKV
jgi:hypothetical protein